MDTATVICSPFGLSLAKAKVKSVEPVVSGSNRTNRILGCKLVQA